MKMTVEHKGGGKEASQKYLNRLRELENENRRLTAEIEQLRTQLPPTMQDCTIRFRECPVGHGWLTAKNWIQHDCAQCEIEQTQTELHWLRAFYHSVVSYAESSVLLNDAEAAANHSQQRGIAPPRVTLPTKNTSGITPLPTEAELQEFREMVDDALTPEPEQKSRPVPQSKSQERRFAAQLPEQGTRTAKDICPHGAWDARTNTCIWCGMEKGDD